MRFLSLLIILFLASCGSLSNNRQLIDKIDSDLKKNCSIDHGYLVAVYDLQSTNKGKYIYAKDYGKIINDEKYYNLFLNKFKAKYKTQAMLDKLAIRKVEQINQLLAKLNNKHRFLSLSYASRAQNKTGVQGLLALDKIVSKIPVMPPEHGYITSNYGMRKCPIKRKRKKKFHCGIDIQGSKSSPIYSSADGIVESVKRMNGYGNIVEIKHPHQLKTRYAHLQKIYVKEGQKISRGAKIGTQGKSGRATGEHLHFEILYKDKHVNPYDFIAHSL
jgi:murein DD-endopeptidase MepM/ murein hydrolase activator NlpD